MQERRHAAIMFTDIVGYTALMGSDEDKAFAILARNRTIHETLIKQFKGHLIKEIGDGILASFSLASDAVRCAIEIQKACKEQNIPLKIGIHEGEMVFAGSDVLGDGVNIASRLHESAEEGCIAISGAVYRDIKNKAGIRTEFISERTFKNVDEPIKVYKVVSMADVSSEKATIELKTSYGPRRKLMYYVLAVIALIILTMILVWIILPIKMTSKSDNSIAVLPFINDSPDQSNQYFCNGMVEEILTQLQKIGDLQVKSRTSVEMYRTPNKDIKKIGQELEVSYILEGSVRKVADNIRVTAQLIDTHSGDHVWSDTYDGKYTNEIFMFQSNVAREVAAALHTVISPKEEQRIKKQSTTDFMAFDLYMKGIDMVDKFGDSRNLKYIDSANDFFDKALTIDPKYSKAFSGKGQAFIMQLNSDSAIFYADKAIELDQENNQGYEVKGVAYVQQGKYDLAFKYLSINLELAPENNWANMVLGDLYTNQYYNLKKGLPLMNKGLRLGGRGQHSIIWDIQYLYFNIGYYDKANKYLKDALALKFDCSWNVYSNYTFRIIQGKFKETLHFLDSVCINKQCGIACNECKFLDNIIIGDFNQAEINFDQFIKDGGKASVDDSIFLAFLYKSKGRVAGYNAIINQSRISLENQLVKNKTWQTCLELSRIHAMQNEKNEALKSLSEASKAGTELWWYNFLPYDPILKILHDDPEFKAIVQKAQDKQAVMRAQVKEMEASGEIDM